ncbi:MAG: histidine phosphatase family protein, partial [Gammaproteobacteria bacterium]|nr:histidine phosphatase family protein [Gammaproteobacteria bacterium]
MKLALLRHAMTDWNRAKRVQGRLDLPLSAFGRKHL